MSLQRGEMLYLLSKEGKGMFMGERVETGDLGTFPSSHVNVIVPLP